MNVPATIETAAGHLKQMIPRLYLPDPLAFGLVLDLGERPAHYLKNVMRREAGDQVVLFNGRDGEFSAVIVEAGRKVCRLRVEALLREQAGVPDIWLCFAPLKKDAIDFLVEKATELGVAAFQPVLTRHTAASRLNSLRLLANAIEAAEQTERLTIPDIRPPMALPALLESWDPQRHIILCAEAGSASPIAEALSLLKASVNRANMWAIFCGPEGGFARSELDLLSNVPFVTPVGLGPRILRADTAALSALAVFQSILGDGAMRPPAPLQPIGQQPD
jgi:16S rRNA (uracil1498-N3)-methyltransferase